MARLRFRVQSAGLPQLRLTSPLDDSRANIGATSIKAGDPNQCKIVGEWQEWIFGLIQSVKRQQRPFSVAE
ncbi:MULTISPECIES: hypothetical protein [Methylosinus]|uniref:Uncharacterized protein n=1 Tax=Methylosinus trichosporium (strain ATCC 35070 / NCIMB 11131 / UNIQEM 75 / OB3b) TaxID=595536 RepID=A0A2D2CWE4_METT3|nr:MULTISPECIES: hypothetical protein [Methylosinus]ATQ67004.1 hypothetical protein CQW49_03230 [Methylosinus trichosporium OB3b]